MRLINKTVKKIHVLLRNVENLRGLAFVTSARNIMSLFTAPQIYLYRHQMVLH